jgi:heme/copper-type cytochrome/quinol oxidase subunit 2
MVDHVGTIRSQVGGMMRIMRMSAKAEYAVRAMVQLATYEPGTLRVNRGDTVVIRLESVDVVHGLYVDGYGVEAQAEPGRSTELRFVADRGGAFRIRCSISCGNMHPFMIGKLVGGPNLTWLRAVLATLVTAMAAFLLARRHA